MSTSNSLVFISHITEEREIAIAFKGLIESSFLGMLNVFVSSDEASIHMGQKWLERISTSLKTCAIEIILCSPKSIKRPWINFEAGAAWVRDIPVIPLCHSGIEPSKLSVPLNLLQAAKANEVSSLKLIFPVLAHAIGAQSPNIDFSDFISYVVEFEKRYTFWDACNTAFQEINSFNNTIIPALKKGENIEMYLTETQINLLQAPMKFLTPNNILKFSRAGGVIVSEIGMVHGCTLTPLAELHRIFSDSHFEF